MSPAVPINAGDTAWVLTSAALVFFMMPGLALFYGGLVGAKNVIAPMAQSFVAIALTRTGCGAVACSDRAGSKRSTSPQAPWCTRRPDSRRSRPCCTSARVASASPIRTTSAGAARRRNPAVRVVRLQRRKRPHDRPGGRISSGEHPGRCLCRTARLDGHRVEAPGQAVRCRARYRRRRGGFTLLGRQSVLALVGMVFPFVASLGVLWVTDKLVGLRVPPEAEAAGLDVGEHSEIAYGLLAEADVDAPPAVANAPPTCPAHPGHGGGGRRPGVHRLISACQR